MIKLIVSDLDGTIVPEATFDIDKEYEVVIEKLINKGIVFALASGRQYNSMVKLTPNIGHKIYFLADNAATIIYDSNVMRSLYLDHKIVKDLIDYSRKDNDMRIVLSRLDGYFIESDDKYLRHKVFENLEGLGEEVHDLYKYIDGTTKVSVLASNRLYEITDNLRKIWGDKLQIDISGSEWIDITDKKVEVSFKTREETEMIDYILNSLDKIKNDNEKVKYLYYEWFNQKGESNNLYNELIIDIKKNYSDNKNNFLKLLDLINAKNNV